MRLRRTALVAVAAILGGVVVAGAQAPESALPPEARERLEYTLGKWSSRTESLDREGKVRSVSESQDERRYVIEDRIVEIVGVSLGSGHSFRAWEYYDVRNGRYGLTSIDRDGNVRTMTGDLGEPFRWTSEPRSRPDGSTMMMRFTHLDQTENSFTALGELSRDGGTTWWAFSRQYMTRRED